MSRLGLAGVLLLAATYHYCMHQMGVWYVFGVHTRWLVWLAFLPVCVRVARLGTLQAWFPRTLGHRLGVALTWAFCAVSISGVVESGLAKRVPADVVDMRWPLEVGAYAVVHGGATESTNQHHPVTAQRYALDVVRVDELGFRARSLWPSKLDDYYAFSSKVVAPCSGEVIARVVSEPDRPPTAPDEQAPAGNFVAIHCAAQDVSVVLAHLQQGSVTAVLDTSLEAGAFVGLIGNSGNTTEPHLHVHAVAGRVLGMQELLYDAAPVPLRFGARFPLRNDVVHVHPETEGR